LTSTEEVNATPTSFTPFSPSFSGSSTATPILGGAYNGDQGTDTLTFEIKKPGTVGSDKIDVDVLDGLGSKIQTVSFGSSDPAGTVKTLSNGLTLSLSAGFTLDGDSFTLNVFDSVGSVVDPDKAFNGTGNDNPNLEFGQSVTAGSFFINSVQIDILATDTINTVATKITNSAAGVTASFDTATERLVLTQQTPGESGQIVLGSDSTGFFDATKLSGATQVPGTDTDVEQPISEVALLNGIGDGNFLIDGVSITVDTAVDSLEDVIARINSSSAQVTASFDEANNEFVVTADVGGATLELADGSSGFFTGVDIPEGIYTRNNAEVKAKTVTQSLGSEFVSAEELPGLVEEFAEVLDSLFSTTFSPSAQGQANAVIEKLTAAVREAFSEVVDDTSGDTLRSGFGITFDFEDPFDPTLIVDAGRLAVAISEEPDALADFLLAEEHRDGRDGLLASLDKALEKSSDTLVIQLDPTARQGLIFDLLA
jgi:hypothetical protein